MNDLNRDLERVRQDTESTFGIWDWLRPATPMTTETEFDVLTREIADVETYLDGLKAKARQMVRP